MDALLSAFVAAGLAEWGDKSQLVVAALAARSGRPGLVMAGLFAATLLSCAAAAAAGMLVGGTITIRAMSLMVALSLLFAGIAGMIRRGEPAIGSPRTPVILAAAILCLAAQMGDRTQFITFALAGRFDSPALAAAGATAGIVAASLPAALLGAGFARAVPLHAIRIGGGFLFLITGFVVAVKALQLA
jgi:Ca2+/H+ antiporter, TMEM165/GDT1 family